MSTGMILPVGFLPGFFAGLRGNLAGYDGKWWFRAGFPRGSLLVSWILRETSRQGQTL